MDQLTKQTQLLIDFKSASERLKEVLAAEATEFNQDAGIQRFEFTFELSWKLMKSLVEFKGKSCASPRYCIRLAADMEIVNDPESWIAFLNDRNALSHTYKQEFAKQVYSRLKKFLPLADQLVSSSETIVSNEKSISSQNPKILI